ncbi:MAG TPA: hypothetical protein VJ729_13645 [Nitrososphaeraceae archaeon]|jgi:hypothetical protein|nr:hypothetical protein [Nitrososphaeraceae archaeon]
MAAASNRKRSTAKEYRCSICNKIFDSVETLNSHVSMEHSQRSHAPAGVG